MARTNLLTSLVRVSIACNKTKFRKFVEAIIDE